MAITKGISAKMSTAADRHVREALNSGFGEVKMVAAVLGSMSKIANTWRKLLQPSGYGLRVLGVFCHQSPQVVFVSKKNLRLKCELGDLLLVVDFNSPKQNYRRAVLIQAKMAKSRKYVSLTNESSKRQLELYQDWPLFSFAGNIYGNGSYDLKTHSPDQSGTFGIIDRHFQGYNKAPPIWTQHPAKPTPHKVTNEPTLGEFLTELIRNKQLGFGRTCTPNGSDDWSRVVDLLLRVAFVRAANHSKNWGKGRTSIAAFVPNRLAKQYVSDAGEGPPPSDIETFFYDEPPDVLSTLHLIIEAA